MEEAKGYTIQEVSELIGVSSRQVRRYIRQGKLEAKLTNGKFGEEYRILSIPPHMSKAKARHSEPIDTRPDMSKARGGHTEPIDITPNMAMDLIKRLEEENRNLAGQLGMAQARIAQLEGDLRLLTDGKKRPFWRRLFRL